MVGRRITTTAHPGSRCDWPRMTGQSEGDGDPVRRASVAVEPETLLATAWSDVSPVVRAGLLSRRLPWSLVALLSIVAYSQSCTVSNLQRVVADYGDENQRYRQVLRSTLDELQGRRGTDLDNSPEEIRARIRAAIDRNLSTDRR